MPAKKKPTAPAGLQPKGRKLWTEITGTYELRADELATLEDACREADLIAQMQAELSKKSTPLTVKGSMGQLVPHPLVGEIRQHRGVQARLLASLKLPDEPGADQDAGERSAKARAAVNARWQVGA